MPGDWQAKSRAFAAFTLRVSYLIELLEDSGMLRFRNANACITNRDLQNPILIGRLNPNSSTLRRKFNRIAQKVIENFLYTDPVCI